MARTDENVWITDVFFNFVDRYARQEGKTASRTFVSDCAGLMSQVFNDCGKEVTPEQLREDFFDRI